MKGKVGQLRIEAPLLFHAEGGDELAALEPFLGRVEQDVARHGDSYFFAISDSLFKFAQQAKGGRALRALVARAKPKPVGFVVYDRESRGYRCAYLRADGLLAEPDDLTGWLRRIREKDLGALIAEKRGLCLLQSPPGVHFESPSGTHCEGFVRVANAIDDMAALRRAAFWLQEELARCGAVLVDTWGMVPVVMEVMRLINRFVPYDALRAHSLAAQQESIKQVTKLFQLCPADQSVLFLQSIRGAGHLVAEIKREVSAADLPPERLRCVNLYGFAPEPGDTTPTFSVLPSVGRYYRSEQQCKMCQEGQEFIRIDPKLYYIVSATEKPVTLTPGFWSPARTFFNRYHAVEGVFRLHADHPYDARHHAFYIDAGALSTSPLFRERLMEKASQPKPDLVVSPGHEAGLKLAGCVGREIGAPIITSEGLRRNTLSADDLDRFLRAKNILILDDVTITGTRIIDYLCAIREDYAPAEIAGKNVAFLLAVARPPSQEQWVAIQRSCSNHDSFSITCDCVEFLALPNWPQAHCPWCHEFDLLQNISARFARPPSWLLARIGALANKRQGLQSSPFWLTAGTTEPVLGFAAKAGPTRMQAIPTLFATASALQRFRHATDPTKALAPGFPISRVLDFPRCFKNYSEGLLRAALLRALRPDEFPASNRKQIRDHALGLIGKHPPGLLLGEVILTTARGGLSLPTRANWDQLLAVHGTDFAQQFAAVVGVRD